MDAVVYKKRLRAPKGITPPTGSTQAQEDRLRTQLLDKVPAIYWLDLQFTGHAHDPRAFPPGGARTAMCRCSACLADAGKQAAPLTPPDITGRAVCVDHFDNSVNMAYGLSPSAQAIEEAERRNVVLVERELPSETPADLRREIRQWYVSHGGPSAFIEVGEAPVARVGAERVEAQ